ncbi:hypothetical protein Q8G40_30310, partial [Klebsiella pneumoniae]|uniref:hypothetical protein n=1 Tax=Klebsiella pneumoniae TaxID=573 RepID=UPI0030139445
ERKLSKLHNLRCKTLGEFKWYRDVFLTRVMQRTDSNAAYWKENFISELPTLFVNKVRDKIVS